MAWQKRYLRSQTVQLGALLGAAGLAAIGDYSMPVVLLFSAAIIAQIYRLTTHADVKWWNGRAGAESAKTAAWLYVMGGAPFGLSDPKADVEFAHRIAEIASKVANLLPVPSSEAHVTTEMKALRARPLSHRTSTYQQERVQGQARWYAAKSTFNEKRARQVAAAAVVAQGLGLALGIAAAVNGWALDFVGLFAAIGATAVAWGAVKQHETLARAYAVASAELSAIDVEIGTRSWTENAWRAFVNSAEEAISREHTSWRASRAV